MSISKSMRAFTLFELVVVLTIISAIVTVAIPYATRSNEARKMEQECLNLLESIKYAIDLATDTRKATRIIIDPEKKIYSMEIQTEINSYEFKPVTSFSITGYHLGPNTNITDISGFDAEGRKYFLLFDPARQWPDASLTISAKDVVKTITVKGKYVTIYDERI